MKTLKGWRTYITSAVLIATTIARMAGIEIDPELMDQIQTGLLALIAIFLRMGVADAKK